MSIPYITLGQTIEPSGGRAAEEIAKFSPSLGNTVTSIIRVLGLSYLVSGVLSAAISVTAYRKGEVWAWYAFWVFPVFLVSDTILNLSIGGSAWSFDLLAQAVYLVGLLMAPQFQAILHHRRRNS